MSATVTAGAPAHPDRPKQGSAVARRLIAEGLAYRPEVAVAVVLSIVGAAVQAAAPYLISQAIDSNIPRLDQQGLAITMLEFLGVYIVGSIATREQVFRIGALGQRLLQSLRSRLFQRFQHLPLTYFDSHPVGDLMSRILNDVDTLNQLISQSLSQLLGSLFSLIGILIAMLLLSVPLALVSFSLLPLILLTTLFFARRAREAFRLTRTTISAVTADLQEELGGVREAQAFTRADTNVERFLVLNDANRDANVRAVRITAAFEPTIDVLNTLSTALVLAFGGYLVLNHGLGIGVVAAFLIYAQQFFRPVQLIAQVYTQLQASLAGAERIYTILDEPIELAEAAATPQLPRIDGTVNFDHVSFGYDADHLVLHDVDLQIEAGKTVALVGPTGAGKSTVANLIPRFYDVSGGRVTIDAYDVRQVTRESLRQQIGVVLQQPFLFSATVAENIGYGKPDATRAEIEAAAKLIECHDFIAALPQGYDTRLSEGGAPLSEGQRHLLSFARAIVGDPRILILDEATSNIDTRTEAIIQRALAKLLEGRTSLVIAHRLSTIQNADLIAVIQAGRIVERGTHEQLLLAKGLYADLYERQFSAGSVTPVVAG